MIKPSFIGSLFFVCLLFLFPEYGASQSAYPLSDVVITPQIAQQQQQAWRHPNRITKDLLIGKITYERDSNFVKVEQLYTDRRLYLLKEVYDAYKQMYKAAIKDGVKLFILTAARPFYAQQTKWNEKWNAPQYAGLSDVNRARSLLSYWSMPGTSRHHWGTEVDLNSMKLSYYNTTEGKKTHEWLCKNAHRFGFYQPYTPFDKLRPAGYNEEKWHWSYRPLAQLFLTRYMEGISLSDISGFCGDYTAKSLNVIEIWMKNISPKLYE